MICIVDYKAGNLRSVERALQKLQLPCCISHRAEDILAADRIIFPGVGAAGSAMTSLEDMQLRPVLQQFLDSGKPFLGICLGTQIIFDHSEEDGGIEALGLLPGNVEKFSFPEGEDLTVPQMGWNQVEQKGSHPIFKDIESNANFYFVHSYYPVPADENLALASTEYGSVKFTCAVAKGNLVATQFHPEKSGRHGLQLLKNFAEWNGVDHA